MIRSTAVPATMCRVLGLQQSYTIINSGGTVTVTGADGTDTLKNIEFLKFDNGAGR